MAIWHVAPLRFAPAFRALGVCEYSWLRYNNKFDEQIFGPQITFHYRASDNISLSGLSLSGLNKRSPQNDIQNGYLNWDKIFWLGCLDQRNDIFRQTLQIWHQIAKILLQICNILIPKNRLWKTNLSADDFVLFSRTKHAARRVI